MGALDDFPIVTGFLGLDLRSGALIIAALGIVHPMVYGCTCFTPMSYLLVTVWILVALFFAVSVALFCGLVHDNVLLCEIWVWFTVIFVALMLVLMVMLALVFAIRRQTSRVFVVFLGILWYILTIYFVLVVNSYRKELFERYTTTTEAFTSSLTTSTPSATSDTSSLSPTRTTITSTSPSTLTTENNAFI